MSAESSFFLLASSFDRTEPAITHLFCTPLPFVEGSKNQIRRALYDTSRVILCKKIFSSGFGNQGYSTPLLTHSFVARRPRTKRFGGMASGHAARQWLEALKFTVYVATPICATIYLGTGAYPYLEKIISNVSTHSFSFQRFIHFVPKSKLSRNELNLICVACRESTLSTHRKDRALPPHLPTLKRRRTSASGDERPQPHRHNPPARVCIPRVTLSIQLPNPPVKSVVHVVAQFISKPTTPSSHTPVGTRTGSRCWGTPKRATAALCPYCVSRAAPLPAKQRPSVLQARARPRRRRPVARSLK